MVEIGTTIEACVTRVEPYGVFLKHGTADVFVPLPEISWSRIPSLHDAVRVGQIVCLRVVRFNYRDRVLVGSMRRAHPEENPYRKLSRLEPGTVLRGKVIFTSGYSFRIELPNSIVGSMPMCSTDSRYEVGDAVDVVITALEVDDGVLELGPAGSINRPVGISSTSD
jgi:ribosomal protein S1